MLGCAWLLVAIAPANTARDSLISEFWKVVDGEPQKGVFLIDSALSMFPESEESFEKAEAYFGKGYAHFENSDYAKAIEPYLISGRLFEAIGDLCYLRRVYFNIGASLSMMGDNLGAIEYYLRSMNVADCEEYQNSSAMDHYNLGMMFFDLKLYQDSKDQYLKAVEEDSLGMNITYRQLSKMSLAYFLFDEGDTLQAIKQLKKVLNQSQNDTLEWVTLFYYGYNDLAGYYLAINEMDSASKYLARCGAIADSLQIPDYDITQLLTQSDFAYENGKVTKALELAEEGLYLAREIGFKQNELLALERVSFYLEELGDYKQAFEVKSREKALADSLYEKAVKFSYLMNELKAKDQKIRRINLESKFQKEQLETRNKEFIGLFLIILILVGFVIYINRQRQQVNRLNKKLQAYNLEKDKIMSSLTNDLRSPLSTIIGVIEMIKLKSIEDLEKEELLDSLSQSVFRLRDSLESLLDWALIQMEYVEPQKTWLTATEEAEKLTVFISPTLREKKQKLKQRIENHDSGFYCDPGHFQLIVRNLLSNASKFTEEGKTITLSFNRFAEAGEWTVTDEGVGMNKKQIKNIKEEVFFKSDGTQGEKGVGLGLRLVSEYVKLNNGVLTIHSQKGKGTTFKILFPDPQ